MRGGDQFEVGAQRLVVANAIGLDLRKLLADPRQRFSKGSDHRVDRGLSLYQGIDIRTLEGAEALTREGQKTFAVSVERLARRGVEPVSQSAVGSGEDRGGDGCGEHTAR